MVTRKYLRERQARKQAEGKQDMDSRCTFCKRALTGSARVDFVSGKKFCNQACWDDDDERTALMEARR